MQTFYSWQLRNIYWTLIISAILIGGSAGSLYYWMTYEDHFAVGVFLYGAEATAIQLPKYAADLFRTYSHVLVGPTFLLIGSLQFSSTIRSRFPKFHRINGYAAAFLACVVFFSANRLAFQMGLGAWQEAVPTVLFSSLFIIFLVIAIYHARNENYVLHREWIIRHYAIALAAGGTIRVLLVSSHWAGLGTEASISTVFWVSFLLNLSVAQFYIVYTRQRPLKAKIKQGTSEKLNLSIPAVGSVYKKPDRFPT